MCCVVELKDVNNITQLSKREAAVLSLVLVFWLILLTINRPPPKKKPSLRALKFLLNLYYIICILSYPGGFLVFIVVLFFEKWFHTARANFRLFMQPRMTLNLRFSCHYFWSVGITGGCWALLIFCDVPV